MSELIAVPFHGETLYITDQTGEPFMVVKPAIENLGLAWQAQHAKLMANVKRWGVTMIVIPSSGGLQEAVCMPIYKWPAFLATIQLNRVAVHLRPKLELYQEESDKALYDYWIKGRAENPRLAEASPIPDALLSQERFITEPEVRPLHRLTASNVAVFRARNLSDADMAGVINQLLALDDDRWDRMAAGTSPRKLAAEVERLTDKVVGLKDDNQWAMARFYETMAERDELNEEKLLLKEKNQELMEKLIALYERVDILQAKLAGGTA